MSDNIRYPSAILNPQQYPSPELSPNPYYAVDTKRKEFDQMQWEPRAGGSKVSMDDRREHRSHTAEDDSSGPELSTPSPQPQVFQADIVDKDADSQDHGRINTPLAAQAEVKEAVLKLSPAMIHELTSSPESLRLHLHSNNELSGQASKQTSKSSANSLASELSDLELRKRFVDKPQKKNRSGGINLFPATDGEASQLDRNSSSTKEFEEFSRSNGFSHTVSTPPLSRSKSSLKSGSTQPPPPAGWKASRAVPTPLELRDLKLDSKPSPFDGPMPSPLPQSIPLPPFSLPTYLQLELSSHRPSPLYIHRSASSDIPYESSRVKIERLQNFLLLPPQLEQVLWFGALACLDAWLFSFTLLPLRFFKALYILTQSWVRNLTAEIGFIGNFICTGTGRMWQRGRRKDSAAALSSSSPSTETTPSSLLATGASLNIRQFSFPNDKGNENPHPEPNHKRSKFQKHRRSKSVPSALLPDHKADILKGLLIVISCTILMYFDASRMYHGIRGQAAIKLYVIYNVLEVCDRLFSALGQDVLECLFSKETLERKPDGRSKILRPLWLFILALLYNLVHATALFYQVITLNVAVNSYSNALLTLLMSNQFVEIKSTVFKKFEKENLFQLTCADVVERFQLWLMLMIIASRNIIETGGLSLGGSDNATSAQSASSMPLQGPGILPKSFTMLPDWTGQVMGPFVLVLGSEMLVDWIKHAYITKFNNTKPAIYGRFLDVLAKDYYSNAFADQNLTRRLGLPVIPLSCLFIRASVQTYHMFLATHMPPHHPSSATSLSVESATPSAATTAALQHIDNLFRRAFGRSSFGTGGSGGPLLASTNTTWNTDDAIALATMIVFFLVLYLVLLALKLVLGMCLLSFARRRYKGMKECEQESAHAEGRRVGGWGVVEVDEDKRRWIYKDDVEGARKLREREAEVLEREREGKGGGFGGVSRYSMVAKRIW